MASTTDSMKSKYDDEANRAGVPGTATGMAERAREAACSLGEQAKDAASSLVQAAEDAASYVGHKAGDAAAYVGHKAEDAACCVSHKAEETTAAVGSGLKSLGNTIRENTPRGGMAGDASGSVANTLESTGRYLQEEGLKGIAKDVTNLIRRNPIPAMLVGVGLGFFIARATSRRS